MVSNFANLSERADRSGSNQRTHLADKLTMHGLLCLKDTGPFTENEGFETVSETFIPDLRRGTACAVCLDHKPAIPRPSNVSAVRGGRRLIEKQFDCPSLEMRNRWLYPPGKGLAVSVCDLPFSSPYSEVFRVASTLLGCRPRSCYAPRKL